MRRPGDSDGRIGHAFDHDLADLDRVAVIRVNGDRSVADILSHDSYTERYAVGLQTWYAGKRKVVYVIVGHSDRAGAGGEARGVRRHCGNLGPVSFGIVEEQEIKLR